MIQIAEDQRTTPTGLFIYAQAYHDAARSLIAAKLRSPQAQAPIEFLQYHAIELFLKAFLRQQGLTVADLKRIGHVIKDLADASVARGLTLNDHDEAALSMMPPEQIFRARYIKTGAYTVPTEETVGQVCATLRTTVRKVLIVAGIQLRD